LSTEDEEHSASCFWPALRYFGTHLAESFLMSKISWIIKFALSRDIGRVPAIFLADILWSSGIMEWLASRFSWIVTWVVLPQCYIHR
jgi:hypothetical protein